MSSTITLQQTVNLISQFARLAPMSGVGGIANEPALTFGNLVRNFILGPPFTWRWNRAIATFNVTPSNQDYVQNLPNFGWLEKATVNDGQTVHELEVSNNLGEENAQEQPFRISSRLDDGNGNITFRFMDVPVTNYTVNISYQKASPTFQSLGDTWSPIPDYLSYIYTQGMLAKMYEYMDNERFPYADQRFLKQVIANSEGITEAQANIFLYPFIDTARMQQSQLGNSNLSRQGRVGY